MAHLIRKAVFPAAGLGTRFLPATAAVPKEMLAVVDKPLIQYAVEEARAAGIEHFIFVIGNNGQVIEQHFGDHAALKATLYGRGQAQLIEDLASIPKPAEITFVRQEAALGLGHAVLCARQAVGNEPFAVLLPDMLFLGEPGGLGQIISAYAETGCNVVAVDECEPSETHQYGIVGIEGGSGRGFRITSMVEKPSPELAPSNLYLSGRYVLQPEIFDCLAEALRGSKDEIQLTDAMVRLAARQPFFAFRFKGRVFDCGSKLGFLVASVCLALRRSDMAERLTWELEKLVDLGSREAGPSTIAR